MMPLYVVVYPSIARYAEASIMNGVYGDAKEKCPLCAAPVSGGEIQFPVCLELSNIKMPDFMYTYGMDMPFVVSQKCKDVLEKKRISGITGYKRIDKIIYKGVEIADSSYYLPEIQRIELPIDRRLSRISYGDATSTSICPLCNPTGKTMDFIFGLYFVISSDSGLDIFKTYELGDCVLVSQDFIDMVKKEKLTNFKCELTSHHDSNLKKLFDSDQLKDMFGTDTLN